MDFCPWCTRRRTGPEGVQFDGGFAVLGFLRRLGLHGVEFVNIQQSDGADEGYIHKLYGLLSLDAGHINCMFVSYLASLPGTFVSLLYLHRLNTRRTLCEKLDQAAVNEIPIDLLSVSANLEFCPPEQ